MDLVDAVTEAFRDAGIELLKDCSGPGDYHTRYEEAGREEIAAALVEDVKRASSKD